MRGQRDLAKWHRNCRSEGGRQWHRNHRHFPKVRGGSGRAFRRRPVNDTDNTAIDFLSRITESLTLDLRNVLATVKENAEFLEDLISADGGLASPEKQRFSHALSVIKNQVARGADLASRLSAFSASPHKPASEMELNELLEMLGRICEPTAHLRGMALRIIPAADPLIVLGNPLQIQMALSDCVYFLLNSGDIRRTIEIRAARRGAEEVMVAFLTPDTPGLPHAERAFRAGPGRWGSLKERVARVNGLLMPGRPPLRFAQVLRNELL